MAYLGGKTLSMEEPELLGFKDEEITKYFRVVKDILEELNRRVWDAEGQVAAFAAGVYLAEVLSSATGTGWYNCKIYEFDKDGTAVEVEATALVLDTVDQYEDVQSMATAGRKLLVHKITDAGITPSRYVGIQLFGRTTIGLCE